MNAPGYAIMDLDVGNRLANNERAATENVEGSEGNEIIGSEEGHAHM